MVGLSNACPTLISRTINKKAVEVMKHCHGRSVCENCITDRAFSSCRMVNMKKNVKLAELYSRKLMVVVMMMVVQVTKHGSATQKMLTISCRLVSEKLVKSDETLTLTWVCQKTNYSHWFVHIFF